MRDLDYIDEAQYEAAMATPLVARLHGPRVELDAPYVTEMVRAEMVARFGPAAYTDGYNVVTTVDSRLQSAANAALATALFEYDRRHGYRGPLERGLFEKNQPRSRAQPATRRCRPCWSATPATRTCARRSCSSLRRGQLGGVLRARPRRC